MFVELLKTPRGSLPEPQAPDMLTTPFPVELTKFRLPGVPGVLLPKLPENVFLLPLASIVLDPPTVKFWLKVAFLWSNCSVPPEKTGLTIEPRPLVRNEV